MRAPTGSYRLDSASALFFGAPKLRLNPCDRSEFNVTGRFGRHGTIKGELSQLRLRATWAERQRSGWMSVTFDETYQTFEGTYGIQSGDSAVMGSCSGQWTGPSP
jgi:hypothetical protein